MAVFRPSSLSFVKKNAKLLQRAYPALTLSVAQEAVAAALGYADWHDASKRIASSESSPSPTDEALSEMERLRRRYQQINALINVAGIPACYADEIVRRWHLTSQEATELPKSFVLEYDDSDQELRELESGAITMDELEERYDYHGGGVPRRVADGIIHGPMGHKYCYYQLSGRRLLDMPLYLRGNFATFLDFEGGASVVLAFPEFFTEKQHKSAINYLQKEEPWLYEWHTGKRAKGFHGMSLAQMAEEASRYPNDWFALAVRLDIEPDRRAGLPDSCVIPALTGKELITFIETKGQLRGLNVQWFRMKKGKSVRRLSGLYWGDDFVQKHSARLPLDEAVPVEPVYGSPFKFGPMSANEFGGLLESSMMLLRSELEEETDDEETGLTEEEAMKLFQEKLAPPA